MGRAQYVLLIALFFELAHSWDLAVTAGDRIEFYNDEGKKTETIRFNSQNLTALAYDEVHNMLLFVSKESDNDAICGYNITSVEYECYVQRNGRNIQDLAFDPVSELLFFTDTNERSINSFSFKSGAKNNVYGNLVIKMDDGIPTDIAVDNCRGYIYWINTNLTTSTIERARFDSSDREIIINATYKLDLHSLAIDQQAHKIYWHEPESHFNGKYISANLNGKNWKKIVGMTNYMNGEIPWLTHPNTLTVSENNFSIVDWCSNCGRQKIWKIQRPEIRMVNHEPFVTVDTESAVGIAANYKMKDQLQGLSDCVKVATEYEGPFSVHGTKVNAQSLCKCTPGYSGVRCEVSACENYCLHGSCSFTEVGLPECRCDAGYSGTRCDSYACNQYCLNNGSCTLNEASEPVCDCVEGYDGERCDVPMSMNNCGSSPREEEVSPDQSVASHEGSVDGQETTTTSSSLYYLVDKNITLADLLENWSKRAQRFS